MSAHSLGKWSGVTKLKPWARSREFHDRDYLSTMDYSTVTKNLDRQIPATRFTTPSHTADRLRTADMLYRIAVAEDTGSRTRRLSGLLIQILILYSRLWTCLALLHHSQSPCELSTEALRLRSTS